MVSGLYFSIPCRPLQSYDAAKSSRRTFREVLCLCMCMIPVELQHHKISCPPVPSECYHLDLGKDMPIFLKTFLRVLTLFCSSLLVNRQWRIFVVICHMFRTCVKMLYHDPNDIHIPLAKSRMACLFSRTNTLIHITFSCFAEKYILKDCLCGLVVRVPG
jgi:hypothetical protein